MSEWIEPLRGGAKVRDRTALVSASLGRFPARLVCDQTDEPLDAQR